MTAETTLGRKLLVLVFGLAVGALLLSILGGSMIWILGGAHGLDVEGVAAATARPADTIDIGNGWGYYGGDPGGHRYSKARQITADNVDRLAPVWEYRTGDMTARAAHMGQAATEGTPISRRRFAGFLHALQRGHRARSGDGHGTLALRCRDRSRPGSRQPVRLPGGRPLAGCGRLHDVRQPHLHGHQRCAADRHRRGHGQPMRGVRRERGGPDRSRHATGLAG